MSKQLKFRFPTIVGFTFNLSCPHCGTFTRTQDDCSLRVVEGDDVAVAVFTTCNCPVASGGAQKRHFSAEW